MNHKINRHRCWEHPKVSVIIPVYKVERYLTQCLNSLVNQTMEELEIIIVDEGDRDRCREIIDYFEAHDPRIIALHAKNGGYGASCNLGMSIAKGEYIGIVESDDFIEPAMYEEMYNYAKKLNADVVKTPFSEYYSNGRKSDCYFHKMLAENVPQFTCFSMKEYGQFLEVHASIWSCIYKTSYIKEKQIKFVEARGGAYVDCVFRVDTLINTSHVAWLDQSFYNYRVDAEGSTTNNYNLTAMLTRWKEVHECSDQECYLSYYGPHLILNEFQATFVKTWLMEVTDEQYCMMMYNLSFSTEDMINNTPVLDKYQRRDLLELKNSPARFRQRVKRAHMKEKVKITTEKILTTLSPTVLLIWMIVGFFTSSFVLLSVEASQFWPFNGNGWLVKLAGGLSLIFLAGTVACFAGKLLRKLYFILLNIYHRIRWHQDIAR